MPLPHAVFPMGPILILQRSAIVRVTQRHRQTINIVSDRCDITLMSVWSIWDTRSSQSRMCNRQGNIHWCDILYVCTGWYRGQVYWCHFCKNDTGKRPTEHITRDAVKKGLWKNRRQTVHR